MHNGYLLFPSANSKLCVSICQNSIVLLLVDSVLNSKFGIIFGNNLDNCCACAIGCILGNIKSDTLANQASCCWSYSYPLLRLLWDNNLTINICLIIYCNLATRAWNGKGVIVIYQQSVLLLLVDSVLNSKLGIILGNNLNNCCACAIGCILSNIKSDTLAKQASCCRSNCYPILRLLWDNNLTINICSIIYYNLATRAWNGKSIILICQDSIVLLLVDSVLNSKLGIILCNNLDNCCA